MKQNTALNILKTGHNVFLTGSAGAGKTYTLNQFIHYLRARRVAVAVTASTGIAATHMNGITIHSWSGIGIKSELTEKDLIKIAKRNILRERLKSTAVLIIDEVSMLHAKQLNLVNEVLKYVRKSDKPFGGVQVVLAGDFFQLPPVGEREETNREKFAFMSDAWLEADFHICYLTEQYRQKESAASSSAVSDVTDLQELTLNDILNQIRASKVTHQAVMQLEGTYQNQLDTSRTRLYTHNLNVDKINQSELSKIQSDKTQIYLGEGTGDDKLVEMLKKTVRTSDELILKKGAKVMFIKNINDLGVSNGTMGEVVGFTHITLEDNVESKQKYPVVKLNTGAQVIASPEEWMVEDEQGAVLASYTQVPLCLAWAITIHKSQGMTLDAAEIDLSRTFEMGQGYVALSRLKSLDGLQLLGLNDQALRLDPLARGADKRFIELSDELQATYEKIDDNELEKSHKEFVLGNGGTMNQKIIDAYQGFKKRRIQAVGVQSSTNKQDTSSIEQTKILLEESLSIAEIAEHRSLAQATIMGHISDLKKQYPDLACEHLRPDEQILKQVKSAYEAVIAASDPNDLNENGDVKLKPIFEELQLSNELEQEIGYNTIRLALIFID